MVNMEYADFLESKQVKIAASGFDVADLNSDLFEFQSDITRWSLRRGKDAIFADCGLGKTPMQLVWADHVVRKLNRPVLIHAPLAVSKQTIREGEKFGVETKIASRQSDIKGAGVYVTNYEKLHHFDPSVFGGIVLDECFPPDTPIDVLSVDGTISKKYIKDVQRGDKILNAAGKDEIKATCKRRIDGAVRVYVSGRGYTCSPNHPFLTVHGWRSAKNLQSGDYLVATETAMRLVRSDFSAGLYFSENAAFLREVLLCEMANAPTGNTGKGSHQRDSRDHWQESSALVKDHSRRPSQRKTICGYQTHASGWNARTGFSYAAENRTQTAVDRRERSRSDETPRNTFSSAGQWVGDRISGWGEAAPLGHAVLSVFGLSATLKEASYRSRWPNPQDAISQRFGYSQDTLSGKFRVDSVEILERGNPALEKYREQDGFVYFYDIEAVRHPSFSVDGILVHNSSILKSYSGATRNALVDAYSKTPMRLCCTATPAPNDFVELGNHSEFLGVFSRTDMLSTFFVHDGGETSKWRLKGHAEEEYWKWICSWAVMLRKPSDLGYSDDGFTLPPLNLLHHVVHSDKAPDGYLFQQEAQGLMERRQARRISLAERVEMCAATVAAKPDQPWLIWCDLNDEADLLEKLIPNSVQVAGRHKDGVKEERMLAFSAGEIGTLISKPSIAGYGMNWQHCSNVGFVGLSDSYESFYQAIRRCWRFGQKNEVNCHVFTAEAEGAVVRNIERKEKDAMLMAKEMVKHMSVYNKEALHGMTKREEVYAPKVERGESWEVRLGDCVDGARSMADDSVHYSIFSPPFASLYTYSASSRDMGNVRTNSEFYEHFTFLVKELYRVLMPGRLLSFHCMNLPSSKERDGVIGLKDFRGDLIRMFADAGFIYHSEVVIWKDPVTAMQRTKAIGLLHKQLVKDSCMSRQGIPDYLVTMRKPGVNPERVKGPLTEYVGDDQTLTDTRGKWQRDEMRDSINIWQRYASPVWMDINPSDTLQKESAREDKDERHICPLQLQVIERGLQLWSNPGDLIYSPFTGIGSEGFRAIEMGRRFIGDELKESYWKQAVANLRNAENATEQVGLFAEATA